MNHNRLRALRTNVAYCKMASYRKSLVWSGHDIPHGGDFVMHDPFCTPQDWLGFCKGSKNFATSTAVFLWCGEEGCMDLIPLRCMSFIQTR